jgi:hypothetical protein
VRDVTCIARSTTTRIVAPSSRRNTRIKASAMWIYPIRCYEDPVVVPDWVVETNAARLYDVRVVEPGRYEFEELRTTELEQTVPPPAGPPPNGWTLQEHIENGRTYGLERVQHEAATRAEAQLIKQAWQRWLTGRQAPPPGGR